MHHKAAISLDVVSVPKPTLMHDIRLSKPPCVDVSVVKDHRHIKNTSPYGFDAEAEFIRSFPRIRVRVRIRGDCHRVGYFILPCYRFADMNTPYK